MPSLLSVPIQLTLDCFKEHALIVGGTGAGKSSRVVYPVAKGMIDQIAAGAAATVVLIDLKGEPWLFHAIRDHVTKVNRSLKKRIDFRWFTPTARRSSFAWNPFQQTFMHQQRQETRVQWLTRAAGVDYGDVYGAKHFRAQAELLLREILSRQQTNIYSFRHLQALIEKSRGASWFTKELDRDSREFQSSISQFAQVPFLNVCADDIYYDENIQGSTDPGYYGRDVLRHQIDLADVITRPQVLYLNLTTTTEISLGRALPRMFLWQLLANLKWLEGSPTNQIYVIVDEALNLATQATNLEQIYVQARSAGMSLTATLHDMNQLESIQLAKILSKNSALEVWFDRPPDWRVKTMGFDTDTTSPRLNELEADKSVALLHLANPSLSPTAHPLGFAQTVRLRYALSLDKFKEYNQRAWPAVTEVPGTLEAYPEEQIENPIRRKQRLSPPLSNGATPTFRPTVSPATQPPASSTSQSTFPDLADRLKQAAAKSIVPENTSPNNNSPSNDKIDTATKTHLSTRQGKEFVDGIMTRADKLLRKISNQDTRSESNE